MSAAQGHTNRLIHESSPYLLQHARNPVDWYPWGDEAFERAAREDKPVFLSIGYSACHWCHVMDRESFADQDVAELLNRDFVSVKVDREERPDVDHFYMRACQHLSGGGGWPLTAFLAPDFRGRLLPERGADRASHAGARALARGPGAAAAGGAGAHRGRGGAVRGGGAARRRRAGGRRPAHGGL